MSRINAHRALKILNGRYHPADLLAAESFELSITIDSEKSANSYIKEYCPTSLSKTGQMRTPIPDYLTEILDSVRDIKDGEVADYIPALKDADPNLLGIAMTTAEGHTYSAGDVEAEFSIQSMSKPFAYAATLTDRGIDFVETKIDVEPSGDAFNDLSIEEGTKRPKNAMINAGAILAHQMLIGEDSTMQERVDRVTDFFSALAGRKLTMDKEVFQSEMDHSHRNLAFAHMLTSYGMMEGKAHEAVAGYTAQCSILVNVQDIAMMSATLATGGVHPVTGERVIKRSVVRHVLSVMASSGMYDSAGEWFTDVGIPAKSGVAGGILGAIPGQLGVGVFSPPLDSHGNSVRGVEVFKRMSSDMSMHMMEVDGVVSRSVRTVNTGDDTSIVTLQGSFTFNAAESLLYRLENEKLSSKVVFDVSRVERFTGVGRRMTLEAMRRLCAEGKQVGLADPEGVLPKPDMGDGTYPFEYCG